MLDGSVFAQKLSVLAQKLSMWWSGFSDNWDWQDPILLVAFLSMLLTSLIPFVLWRLGDKQNDTNLELLKKQSESLERQECIAKYQRRDSLRQVLSETSDEAYLRAVWAEIKEFSETDRKLLKSIARSNPKLSLPGSIYGLQLSDEVDQDAVDDYFAGFGRRYGVRKSTFSYPGLLGFLALVSRSGLKINTSSVVQLVTGESAAVERPTHEFFRDLVLVHPPCAAALIFQAERIDPQTAGGLRLNVLTGTFLAIKLVDEGDAGATGLSNKETEAEFRSSTSSALAQLMHRGGLRGFEKWSYRDASECSSATVAWLIRVVGYFADVDRHLAMRMIQNLELAICSIPVDDRPWRIDARDVCDGSNQIREKQPALWSLYGEEIEKSASVIGPWRS